VYGIRGRFIGGAAAAQEKIVVGSNVVRRYGRERRIGAMLVPGNAMVASDGGAL
jgi:hypothetical protein